MLIHSKPSASIQEFARAFGLKKDRFAAAFFLEGLNRTVFLFLDNPSIGDEAIYVVRLLSYLLILAVIANKNRTKS